MAANGISELATKELKQKAKLDLAATKRASDGNARATYDLTLLPTQYNDNDVINNPNLAVGVSGIKKVTYTGYHTDDVAFTDTATVTDTTTSNNFTIASIAENTTVLYTGYLLATYTGTWTFTLTSDDGAYLWIGNTAVSGYSTSNELAASTYNTTGTGTISLTDGEYYPIRLLYGNGPAGGNLNLTYAHTGQSATSDFTGKLFSPSVSLVQGRPWITTTSAFTFFEAFGTTAAISTTRYVSGNKIYSESSTYDVPSYQPARVIVNDIEVANTELRGHTLVVLDSYGDVVTGPTQYDTYIDPANLTALASALNAVASGNIVVLVTYDASALDAGVRSAINTGYGSTNTDTWTAQRQSHIFIGEKI
jgi:GLEYA domain/Interleukin-like EMT inducer